MLDQTFSPSSLLRLVQREDVARYRMWGPRDDRDAIMRQMSDVINASCFEFPRFKEKPMKGKTLYSAPDATTMFALRKLDKNIRAIYKVKQSNRDSMVHQVKSLLQEGCAFTVLRLDVRSFYESINRDEVLAWIERDSILSYTSRILLRKLFDSPQFARQSGVPRGLGISATLAELYVRSFDRHIRSLRHVYFYGRYVDDIILFTHVNAAEVETELGAKLNSIGLTLNPDKRTVVECSGEKYSEDNTTVGFDFLGYNLKCRRYLRKQNQWRDVWISIALSKLKKLKSRIALAFVNYSDVPDFALLNRRLRFLAGNYILQKTENGNLCGGIYYNYHHITDHNDLDDLDKFMRKLIFSRKGSIGRRLSRTLTNRQRQKLSRIGFRAAFTQRFSSRLPWGIMTELRKCWAYEKN